MCAWHRSEPVPIGELARQVYSSGYINNEGKIVRDIVPVQNLGQRPPEHGRIRLGVKTEKAMTSIDTLRFTSPDQEAIEMLALTYGGEARPWTDRGKRKEFEVVTTSTEIPVILPPDPLNDTPIYELWSGGGIQRRCNGVTCEVPVSTPDGVELEDTPCLCMAKELMECRVVTRLSVIIPIVKFRGTWRLETKGWNAAHELPEMVNVVMGVQGRMLTRAVLGVEKREGMQAGKKKHFVVPYLRLDASIEELAAGMATLEGVPSTPGVQAGSPPAAALGSGRAGPGNSGESAPGPALTIVEDDEVVDAEVVPDENEMTTMLERINELAVKHKLRQTDVVGFASYLSEGKTYLIPELDYDAMRRLLEALEKIDRLEVIFSGFHKDGRPILRRLAPREEGA